MIAIIARESQKSAIEEFFQLFKTPWEYYDSSRKYDTVIITNEIANIPDAKLVMVFNSEMTSFDKQQNLRVSARSKNTVINQNGHVLPIYGHVSYFPVEGDRPSGDKIAESASLEIRQPARIIVRVGYDLFDEIDYLLSHGQMTIHAHIPTIEIHILLLRKWLLKFGIQFVEIPPVPEGYDFIVCLTHDVDFINIRDHKFDRSVVGFIVRALFPGNLRDSEAEIAWRRIFRNWKALLSIPFVYLGMARDIWFDIDRYCDIERDMKATYFFIPFKKKQGELDGGEAPSSRAASYDIYNYKPVINDLQKQGHEVGLHGIDAWTNPGKGILEQEVIRNITGELRVGVRMHWLFFNKETPVKLEEAGFHYDSSKGYNENVGYWAGTSQVFKLPGTSGLLELPLTLMDTALFYGGRMGLTESSALDLCKGLIDNARTYGGAMTINWHTRSLSPERNWDDFYKKILDLLKAENVWFATASEAVKWFEGRRQIRFEEVRFESDKVFVKLQAKDGKALPLFQLRVHNPGSRSELNNGNVESAQSWVDTPWSGEHEMKLSIEN